MLIQQLKCLDVVGLNHFNMFCKKGGNLLPVLYCILFYYFMFNVNATASMWKLSVQMEHRHNPKHALPQRRIHCFLEAVKGNCAGHVFSLNFLLRMYFCIVLYKETVCCADAQSMHQAKSV